MVALGGGGEELGVRVLSALLGAARLAAGQAQGPGRARPPAPTKREGGYLLGGYGFAAGTASTPSVGLAFSRWDFFGGDARRGFREGLFEILGGKLRASFGALEDGHAVHVFDWESCFFRREVLARVLPGTDDCFAAPSIGMVWGKCVRCLPGPPAQPSGGRRSVRGAKTVAVRGKNVPRGGGPCRKGDLRCRRD